MSPEYADLGITDLDQLVSNLSGALVPCEADEFNNAVNRVIDNHPQNLLVDAQIQNIIRVANTSNADNPSDVENENSALAEVLENWARPSDSSLLFIPACATDSEIRDIVRGSLGALVSDVEIAYSIILGLDAPDPESADGCRAAQIVDVTQLHAEVLRRFQVKLATDPRVVEAEREALVAQGELIDFMRLHEGRNPCIHENQPINGNSPNCQKWLDLFRADQDAGERYAGLLSSVYAEQQENGLMPPYNIEEDEEQRRREIMLGIAGIFIPQTAQDGAIEAALWATPGFVGELANIFEGAVGFVRGLSRSELTSIEQYFLFNSWTVIVFG